MRPDKLTARELEVARLVSEATTNSGISDSLGISEHTVRSHLRAIRRKLGLGNRVAIAVWYARDGWPNDG